MTAVLTGEELEAHVLDAGRNDYYGHAGSWTDVQDSTFLERLDSADRTPPTAPEALRVGDDPSGLVRVSWQASTDDVGPVAYRVYQDGRFVRQVTTTSVLLSGETTGRYAVRAADPVGRLSNVAAARFRPDLGMIDEQGRLVRDTVRPPSIARVTIKRLPKVARAHLAGRPRRRRPARLPRQDRRADDHRPEADDHDRARERQRRGLDRRDRPRRQRRARDRDLPQPPALVSRPLPRGTKRGMTEFGYWLSSEEHGPLDLVRNAARAEEAGFSFAMISDHFHPWIDAQGQSPFVWSVLGGIAQATERIAVATGVTCPLIRIHPAIVAQAAATAARCSRAASPSASARART